MIYVIIPTYNRAHTLIRAISSVLSQDGTHCIIIDDGSTDNTKQLIDLYVNKNTQFQNRFSYFYKKNGWVSDACNYGIERALEISKNHNEDLVTRLGSDDEFFPDAFSRILTAVHNYPEAGIFYFRMVNEGAGNRTHMSEAILKLTYKEYLEGKKLFWDDANDVIRLSVLENSYYRFESDLWGGDSILFHKIIRESYLVAFDIPTYLVHMDTYSMTRSFMDERFCSRQCLVQKRILDIFWEDYRVINKKLLGLHYLILSRFTSLLWKKSEWIWYLFKWIRYRPTDFVRITLAVIALFPKSMLIINGIIRLFLLQKNSVHMIKKNIPISQPIIEQAEIDAVVRVMKTGNIVQWSEVAQLEKSFSDLTGKQYAIAVNSWTAAIHVWLYGLWVWEWDEVITSPFTFVASANPILMQRAKVVFADINEDDYLINVDEIEKKITNKTKAVIPVSLYGQVYDFEKLNTLAKKHNFSILEDACQSVWAKRNGVASWACGDMGAFSLYATKNIMCWEGGILVTDDKLFAERARSFRQHGMEVSGSYMYQDMGYNYRLPDMLAAIANVQFGKLSEFTEKRRDNARILSSLLQGIPWLILPKENQGNFHVFHQYTIRVTEDFPLMREDLMAKLQADGVGLKIYYPIPIHLYSHFAKFGYKEGDFPIAEKIAKQVFSLPIHPSITREDLEYIASRIRFYSQNS